MFKIIKESKEGTITFANRYAKVLWDEELSGQISDGMYENSSPDWEYWCGLQSRVGSPVGRTNSWSCRRDGYSFNGLYDIVGDRIEQYLLGVALDVPDDLIHGMEYLPERIESEEQINRVLDKSNWSSKYAAPTWEFLMKKYKDFESLKKAYNTASYPDYRSVLRDVKQAMKTVVQSDEEIERERQEAEKRADEATKVYIVNDGGRWRARANDGEHGDGWVQFPNNLRLRNAVYRVGELIWNGKNYRVRGNIERIDENLKRKRRLI